MPPFHRVTEYYTACFIASARYKFQSGTVAAGIINNFKTSPNASLNCHSPSHPKQRHHGRIMFDQSEETLPS